MITYRLVLKRLAKRRAQRAATAAWERAKQPKSVRDPLWSDFQNATLRADGERLADIGDWVMRGCPVELFSLTANERIVVDAYCSARITDA